jgi:sugar transferase (PEP-CTERM/EpsH1 system associated)
VRVLFLTHRLPYAPNRGDRLRAYHMLRAMRADADVDLVSLVHDRDEASHAPDLRDLASSVTTLPLSWPHRAVRSIRALAGSQPLTHALLDAPGAAKTLASLVASRPPDVVLAFCSSMARFGLEPPLAGLPLVVDLVDVDSSKWHALSATARWPLSAVYRREAACLASFEALIARSAAATLVVNERERQALRAIVPDADPVVLQNGVDVEHFRPPTAPSSREAVVFTGVMNYAPNAQAAIWLAEDVWPLVRQRRPGACLDIVGASPTGDVKRLAHRYADVTVTGSVPSVREYLWNAAIAVAPLRVARGVQNKVVEAVAAGLPCVVTPAVFEGVPAEIRPACHVRDDARAFAEVILDLLERSPTERRALASRGDVSAIDWPSRMHPLLPLLRETALRRAPLSGTR